MTVYTVKLMTVSGEVEYPDYREEKATFTPSGNIKDILFTPYNGRDPSFIISVTLDSRRSKDCDIRGNHYWR